MTIQFELSQEITDWFAEFDTWAKDYLQQNSERLFGQLLTTEQVDYQYISCLKEGKGCKFKINMQNSARPCCFWNADASEAAWPLDWNSNFAVKVKISHLWHMGSGAKLEYGFVMLLEDACQQKVTHAFPFGKSIPSG